MIINFVSENRAESLQKNDSLEAPIYAAKVFIL